MPGVDQNELDVHLMRASKDAAVRRLDLLALMGSMPLVAALKHLDRDVYAETVHAKGIDPLALFDRDELA